MTSKFAGLELDADTARRMTIKGQDGAPIRDKDGAEAWIDLLSQDSEAAKKHEHAITRHRLELRNRNKVTPELLEEEAAARFAALTVGWHLVNPVTREALALDCTPANARELYANRRMRWLRDQVRDFVEDDRNFTPTSSTS